MNSAEQLSKPLPVLETASQKSEKAGSGWLAEIQRLTLWKTNRFPSPPYLRARGNRFWEPVFHRHSKGGKNRKEKAPVGANSKAQSEDRLPGRQPYASAPLWEALTNWRHAQTVRIMVRRPVAPECIGRSNRSLSKRDQHGLDGTGRVLQAWRNRDPGATTTESAATGRPSQIPTGTPSDAMVASMELSRISTNRSRKLRR